MRNTSSKRNPQYFVHSLQQYILAPLSAAARLVDRERTEVKIEKEAFEEFHERLTGIDPAPSTPPDRAIQIAGRTSTPEQVDRVRTAYRETVLNMPHYDDVYDEALIEHFANEFDAAVADGVRPGSSTSFTASYKNALDTKTMWAIHRREEFLETLNAESQSLETSRTVLSDILAALDTTIIPEWHRESFREQLDAVAQRRQQTVQERDSVPRFDEHSLCAYLYEDAPWTYPVLTAVARTREAVSLDHSTNPGNRNSAQR